MNLNFHIRRKPLVQSLLKELTEDASTTYFGSIFHELITLWLKEHFLICMLHLQQTVSVLLVLDFPLCFRSKQDTDWQLLTHEGANAKNKLFRCAENNTNYGAFVMYRYLGHLKNWLIDWLRIKTMCIRWILMYSEILPFSQRLRRDWLW